MPLDPKVLRDIYGEQEPLVNPFPDARKINPDAAAKGLQASREFGIDAILAAEKLPDLQDERDQKYWDELVKTSPVTARHLSNASPAVAAATQDNVENLSGIEQAFLALKNTGKAAVSGLRSASAGSIGIARAPLDFASIMAQPLVGTVLPANPFGIAAEGLAEWQQEIAGRAKAEMPQGDGVLGSGYYSGIASLSRNLAALPLAFLPGGQEAALGAMVAPVFGEGYGQARDAGKAPGQSLVFGTSQAAIEYATEKLPLTKLLGDLKEGAPFLKTLLHNAALEVPGEQIATVLQDLNDWAVINPDKPFADYINERPNAAAQTLIATLVGTGGQVSVMEGVSKAVGYAEKRADKAQQAEQQAAFLENMNKLAAADKLLQRSPDDFQSFVAAAAEDGPVDTVFIDGKTLMQSGMAPQLAELSPAVRDQLDRAIVTGGQIAIPVDEYAARIAPTDLAPQLIDHLKTDAEGFSRAEAADFMTNQGAELQAEVERILSDQQDTDAFRTSQDVVKQDILGQLNTAGRFTPQVNEAYATLASAYSAVRAAQLGMTPEAFHAERGMRVQGAAVAGDRFDQTGKLVTDTPEFKRWSEGELINADDVEARDFEDGQPVTIEAFHGTTKGGFAVFNTEGGSGKTFNTGAFFTESRRNAATYSGRDRDVAVSEDEDFDPKYDGEDGIYHAFIKMRNPKVIDAEGQNWDSIGASEEWFARNTDGDIVEYFTNEDDANHFRDTSDEAIEIEKSLDPGSGASTDDLVRQAREEGYDGVIIRNVTDEGPHGQGYHWGTHTFVVFEPTQIKSAIGNRGTFDPTDPNILNQSGNPTVKDSFTVRPPKKLYRGVAKGVQQSGAEGIGTYMLGKGLYSSPSKRFAKMYGEVIEVSADEYFPRNPLVLDQPSGYSAPDVFRDWLFDVHGFKNLREFNAKYPDPGDFVRSLGYDGVVIGDEIVRYPSDNILNQSAYHGSPFKFDKFSLDHMGKGEGAQAYGWGLYFAGKREVAEYYRKALAPTNPDSLQRHALDRGLSSEMADTMAQFYAAKRTATFADFANEIAQKSPSEYIELFRDKYLRPAIADGSAKAAWDTFKEAGQLYEVNIPEEGEYLLWDKPLSEQPEKVRAALLDAMPELRDQSAMEANEADDLLAALGQETGEGAHGELPAITGEQFYQRLVKDHSAAVRERVRNGEYVADTHASAQEDASKYLNSLGIAGIKYLDGTSRDKGEGSYNYVIFDESAVQILQTYYQPDGDTNRGAFSPATNTVTLLNNADLSTFLHESAHYFFESDIQLASELLGKPDLTPGEQQIVDDVSRLLTWHGIQGDVTEQLRQWHTMDFEEQRSHHERTAESFEAYLFSGRAPSLELQPVFQRFAAWMVNVYKSIKDFLTRNPEAGKLNDEVRSVFDRMIATREEIALAEQARSMMPLFSDPAKSGMTPEDYAAYQAQGVDATNEAIQELQAKGLRDLQWLKNARGRQVAKLKKLSKALRAEAEIEARREVMSQPVYRAWEFLTGRLKEKTEAQTENEKEVADWKQRRQEAMDAARDQAKKEAWDNSEESKQDYESGRAKGMAKGQLLARQKKDVDLIVARAALDWDRANPRPVAAQDSNVFDQGEQVFGKFNRAALEDMGIPDEIIGHIRNLRMTATDGRHPDLVAMMILNGSGKPAFSSGDELVRTLAAAPSPKEAIAALTDRMMLENHGELATPEAIERAADAAIHNDARARMLTTEANALAKATGKPRMLATAAKEYASAMIARLKVRDIKPGQYANAEVRAAKASAKAEQAGDLATAAAEKRNQVINTYATRAAYDAQDEVQAGLRYLRRFDKRSKSIDPEYQDQIEAMLERFELRAISNKAVDRRASLAQWLTAQRESGLEPDIDPKLENEAFRTSYKNMTVEEFRGLVDAVQQIEHLGRLKNKLLTAKDKREFKAIVEEVAGSIIDNGGKPRKVELETPTGIRPWLEGFAAGHRKLASLVRQMDGGKDGGPFWRVFVRTMNEASTNETVMIEQATVKLAELYKPLLDMKGGLNGDKQFIPEINDSLTRGGRLSVALNWGNSANRQRILDGDGWTEHQVQAILNRLTREELQFVNNVWAFIDSYWPAIEAKEKRVTGRAPEKVKAEPFTLMVNGETVTMSGGYYPIKYDSNRDDRAEKHDAAAIAQDMMRGAMTRATTRRGHTKARTESVNRPVKKTLDVITQHVSEVTHDLAWHEWLIDANRLIDARDINQAIREHYGTEVLRTMKDALTGIATADIVPQTKIDTALLYLRANVSRSTMGLSLTTAFLQPFGLAQSMVRIGTKPVLRGMARWAGDASRFESSMTWISEKSEFMRLRSKTFNRELHEIKGRVSKGHSKARTIYDASLFMLMQKMQMVADVPTWIGAYEKAVADPANLLADGTVDEAKAVALADQAVLDSQGGGQTKDMAEFQRKHPFLAMFYSYFNTTLNLAAESTAKTDFKNPLALAGWASDMALLMIIPALGPAMLLALMRGEECGDAEECALKLAKMQAGYLLGTVLGVRELSGPVSGFDYAGPPVGRVVAELSKTGTQIAQGEADEGLAKSTISLLGVSLGIPTTQILRSYRGWKAWEEGDAPATSVLLGPPQKD